MMNSTRDKSLLNFFFKRRYGIGIISLAFALIGSAGLAVVLFAVSEKVRKEHLGVLTVCLFVLVIIGFFTGIFGVFEKRHRWCAAAGAIIAGLFLVFVARPAIDWERKYGARKAFTVSSLKSIGQACSAYAQDNSGCFPDDGLAKLYPDYVGDKRAFHLPFEHHPAKEMENGGPLGEEIDFEYVKGLTTDDSAGYILAYVWPPWDSAERVVLFVDGRVETMSESSFQRRLEETKKYLREKDAGQ
jgi:hypothetical protein